MDAAESEPSKQAPQDDGGSLESTQDNENSLESTNESSDSGVIDATSHSSSSSSNDLNPKKGGFKQFLRHFNVYLLMFALLLVIGGVIIAIAYFQSQKASVSSTLKTQTLTQNTLNQVANSDATVGNTQQVLNVESSAVFAGKVLVREDLEVAGSLQIGGTVALTDLAVSGTSSLSQLLVSKDIAVTGNAAIQGAMTIAQSLQVNGAGTFSGPLSAPQITTPSLQLNGDLVLTHHISAGGPTPGRTNGPALGGGGTASVSGSDTSGSVVINTGSSPSSGCFITINFATPYNSTPHVLISPTNQAAGGIGYYATRTTTSFSICAASAPAAGSSFGFDYFVVD